MKKSILNLGKAIKKEEQKNINGGTFRNACPCASSDFEIYSDGSCSYVANQPGFPFRCLGEVQNGLCCVN